MKHILIASLALVAAGFSTSAMADFELTCESNSGQTRNCPINGTYNQVFLKTQLSRASCYEGSSWGVNDSYIWVSNGCRATFRVDQGNTNYSSNSYGNRYDSSESSSHGKAAAAAVAVIIGAAAIAAASNKNNSYGSYSNADDRYTNNYDNDRASVTCESRDQRRASCPIYVGRGSVRISRKLSSSACRFGQDWDYDRNNVYVWNGCRAEFTTY